MHSPWLILVLALVLPHAAGESSGAPSATSPNVQARLEAMDAPAREAWARMKLARLDRANRVVLEPAAVAQQHARVEKIIRPFVDGTSDWRRRVEFLNHELQLAERAAVDHLARRFRMTLYRTFRLDRPEYDRRRATLMRLVKQWKAADSPADQQHKVVDWLLLATERSATPDAGTLPPLPSFASQTSPAASVAIDEPPKPTARAAVAPLADPKPADLHVTPESGSRVPEVVRPSTLAGPPVAEPSSRAVPEGDRTPHRAGAAPIADAGSTVTTPRRPTSPPTPPAAALVGPPEKKPTPVALPIATEVPKPRATPRLPVESPPAGDKPVSPPVRAVADAEKTPRRGVAAPVVDDTSTSIAPRRAARPSPPSPTATLDEPPEPAAVRSMQVNVSELAAKIAGNNMALRRLAAELDQKRTWDARQLEPKIARLAPLVARTDDLAMIRDLLPERGRARVGQPESPGDIIGDLGAKIAAARSRVQSGSFSGTQADRQAELDRLDALSRKLAEMVVQRP